MRIRRGDDCKRLYGRAKHPPFRLLAVSGMPADDCWIDEDLHVCVSDRMLETPQAGRLTDCGVTEL